MAYEKMIQVLKHKGYKATYFETAAEATEYLVHTVKGVSVGFGDSATLATMNLATLLSENNRVIDPSNDTGQAFIQTAKETLTTDVFFTSVNGAAETGELVNIDGTGNRVAGSLFGHKRVYFVFGTNKIVPTIDKAIWRARNVSAPQNAKRFGYNTPCAIKGDRCYDCTSTDRICNTLNIHLQKLKSVDVEVIIINESLGL